MRTRHRTKQWFSVLALVAAVAVGGMPQAAADPTSEELARIKVRLDQLKADTEKTHADKVAAEAARGDALKAAEGEKDPGTKKALAERAERELQRMRHDDVMEQDYHKQFVTNEERRTFLEDKAKKERKP